MSISSFIVGVLINPETVIAVCPILIKTLQMRKYSSLMLHKNGKILLSEGVLSR